VVLGWAWAKGRGRKGEVGRFGLRMEVVACCLPLSLLKKQIKPYYLYKFIWNLGEKVRS
jgi:hypothetical protein